MPIPFIVGAIAALTGATGICSGIYGGVKMKEANDTAKSAKRCHEENVARFEKTEKQANEAMDNLGKTELTILNSFKKFQDLFEKIKNRPDFGKVNIGEVDLPEYNPEELEKVYIGAGLLLGGLGGAALGTAGAFAASGATTAAIMAWGTASTGTAISTLSGAAATNAVLAWLGGGAIAAGGGGMALGSALLGGATLGVGLLVGGVVFAFSGSKLSDKADEAWSQMIKAEKQINEICSYLNELKLLSKKYLDSLNKVNSIYKRELAQLATTVEVYEKTDYNSFTYAEQTALKNTVLLVKLLKVMCEVQLVLKAKTDSELGTINKAVVETKINDAKKIVDTINLNIYQKDNCAAVPDSFDILITSQCSYVYNGKYNFVYVGEVMPKLYGEKKYISISGKFNGLELPEIKGCIGACSLSNQKTFIPFEISVNTTLMYWCLSNINNLKYLFDKHNITENEIYDLANSYDLPSKNTQLNIKWMKLAEELLRSSNECVSKN